MKRSAQTPVPPVDKIVAGMEAGEVGIWDWDVSQARIYWSPNLEKIHGLPEGYFDGTFSFFENDIHPDDRTQVLQTIREALAHSESYRVEYRLGKPANGETRWLEARGHVIRENGRPTGMTGVCQDITERKQTEIELGRRIRQQEGVARLGQLALKGVPLDTLFDAATREATDLLDAEFCKILEILPSGDDMLLRAGIGWKEGLVGHAHVPADLHSQAGYTLKIERAILVEDVVNDTRFQSPQLLIDHGVRSGVSVIIGGEESRSFGVIGVHSREPGHFGPTDLDFVQSVANILAGAIQRHQAMDRQLLLMRELRHRVGNLLTLILSLFNNSARNASSVDDLFEKFVARVMSLSRAHTHLSYGGWSTTGLLRMVHEVLEPFLDRIKIEGNDIRISADSAFALSLALHELVTNAVKYGGLSAPYGSLSLKWWTEHVGDRVQLVIRWLESGLDNIAAPEDSGFGSKLVATVIRDQLGGELALEYLPTGLRVHIRLPLDRVSS